MGERKVADPTTSETPAPPSSKAPPLAATRPRWTPSSAIAEKRRHRLRYRVRPTPWRDASEFDAVGRGLLRASELFAARPPEAHPVDEGGEPSGGFEGVRSNLGGGGGGGNDGGSDADEVSWSVRRVALWRCRSESSGGRLPHAVETTACLAEALLSDSLYCGDGGGGDGRAGRGFGAASSSSLRLSYSTAIIRAVNGLADAAVRNRASLSLAPGGVQSASVSAACERLGLPGWIVDLRHEAAHNDLPLLPALRLAAEALVRYLGDRYWGAVWEARGEAWDGAVELLVRCKAASKERMRAAARAKTGASAKEEEDDPDDDDDDDDEPDDQDEGDEETKIATFNYFSILADPPKPAASRKEGSREEKKSTKEKPPKGKEKPPSARKFARQFVQSVPIDMGMRALMSYLVWGGAGDAPPGRGALIPGSPAAFPATAEGVERIRIRYDHFLIAVASTWTGFLHSLLVNVVDFILSIEEAATAASRSAAASDSSDDAAPPSLAMDAGDARKVYFLLSWARYLLSREFHAHFYPDVALYPASSSGGGGGGGAEIDLRRKIRRKRTDEERAFMEGPAPPSVLREASLPLNGLCDRCATSAVNAPGGRSDASPSAAAELTALFESALGDGRVEGMGLGLLLEPTGPVVPPRPAKRRRTAEENAHEDNDNAAVVEGGCGDPDPSPGIDSSAKRNRSDGGGSGRHLSLEEIEALLTDSDEEEEKEEEKATPNDDGIPPSDDGAPLSDSDREGGPAGVSVKRKRPPPPSSLAWVRCKSWDACAIGTLPAHPT